MCGKIGRESLKLRLEGQKLYRGILLLSFPLVQIFFPTSHECAQFFNILKSLPTLNFQWRVGMKSDISYLKSNVKHNCVKSSY